MAQARTADGMPLIGGLVRRSTRNIRATVLFCVLLIGGTFAAAALLQMRNDRIHALAQAEIYESERAADIAAAAGASLDRLAARGRAFADGQTVPAGADGIANITVFDASGLALKTQNSLAARSLPPDALTGGGRRLLPPGTLVVPDGEEVIAIDFDPRTLLPARLIARAGLMLNGGQMLVRDAAWSGEGPSTAVPGWPLVARTSVDAGAALEAWEGSLPLYLFVILGPALAGGALAAVFVREFERRARAAEAVRSLKATRPVEAKLLVRLASAERAAAEDARAKSEFIAHMSHELRTPLNAIIGFSDVIGRGFYGAVGHPKYVEYANDINAAGRALHDKIGDILEFANVEAGRYPLSLQSTDLCAVAQATVGDLAGRAFSRRIALDIGFAHAGPALADPLAAARILTSLISNALVYTPEGGAVRVEVREEEAAIVARVADTGPGFTREEREAAGAPFRRFDRAGATTGAGMGLAIAMSLARRMDGAIKIGGVPGGGTVAELRLGKWTDARPA